MLELIEILDAIDRYGSFESAAKSLFKVRSALTYTIQKFEQELSIQIFDRSKHRARLTDAGNFLLNQGRHLLSTSEHLKKQVQLIAHGFEPTLKIAYDEIIPINPLFKMISNFQKNCPQTQLDIYSEILGGCADALLNERADIAIGITQPLPHHSHLIFKSLGKISFVFVVSPKHPLANCKKPISLEQIRSHYIIAARDSGQQSNTRSSMVLAEQTRLTFSTLHLKKLGQINGLGVGFLPYHLVKDEILKKQLIIKSVEQAMPDIPIFLGWNKTKMGKTKQWFIQKIKNSNWSDKN